MAHRAMTEQQIPLLNLRAQHASIQNEIMAAIARVVESQQFVLGDEVGNLEEELAAYCGAKYAVGCASGSDALLLALMALEIGPGDAVLTVPFTFFATASAISRVGARPLFVDIEPASFNMDVSHLEDVLRSHPRIRAIIPVHLFGACADMDPLMEAAARCGAAVIEDAAQSIGAEYKNQRAGSMGAMGCFSFYPTKNLGGYGDGGMITTNSRHLAERLKALRVHGSTEKYLHTWMGINSRLDALQAAVLRVKFRHLDYWSARRKENADLYRELLTKSGVPVTIPQAASYQTCHVYNQFVIRCAKRDKLRAYLQERGIGTEVYYPVPLHLQPCFAGLSYKAGDFPVSETAAGEVLALPIGPELLLEQIEYICRTIQLFYE